MAGRTVCVTGASGFIAGHLVKQLLNKGYNVVGTVRSLNNQEAVGYLQQLPGASERLRLVEADLMSEGSFDAAFQGCEGVFHIASPFFLHEAHRDELMRPATEGSLNVYRSCARASSVTRVVATSSFATILFGHDHTKDPAPYTELDYNRVSSPDSPNMADVYRASKVAAEQAGINFLAEQKPSFDIVTIHPPFVLGPWLPGYTRPNESSIILKKYLTGEMKVIPDGGAGFIDVRDVARAHILAYEQRSATGRYLIASASRHWKKLMEELQELYPEAKLPTEQAPGNALAPNFDCSKAKKELNFEPEFSFIDTLRAQCEAFMK